MSYIRKKEKGPQKAKKFTEYKLPIQEKEDRPHFV
jgi:hypothetical protein